MLYSQEILVDSSIEVEAEWTHSETPQNFLGIKRVLDEEDDEDADITCEVVKAERKAKRQMMKEMEARLESVPMLSQSYCVNSCSLFNSLELTWQMSLPSTKSSDIRLQNVDGPKNSKNGIYFQIYVNDAPLQKYLTIQLYETDKDKEQNAAADRLVAFCSGKCGKKRNAVIELQDAKSIRLNSDTVACNIALNEQCAHRSTNGYGSPSVRFYFRITISDAPTNKNPLTNLTPIATTQSPHLIVVAPGKSKTPAITKGTQPKVKMTMKDTVEALYGMFHSLDQRIAALESRVYQHQTMTVMQSSLSQPIIIKQEPTSVPIPRAVIKVEADPQTTPSIDASASLMGSMIDSSLIPLPSDLQEDILALREEMDFSQLLEGYF